MEKNVVVLEEQTEIGRVPLHNLQAIITFGYTGASPALMGACAQRNIDLSFMSGNGRCNVEKTAVSNQR